ncbi:MAG: class I mannose-6-phosphate isomerase [Opitutaceae bacterium]|nr:class I mannose-6-phosphate isomerase [Opitutaceae bacterium]
MRTPNYDKFPTLSVPAPFDQEAWKGWTEICGQLLSSLNATGKARPVVAVECYPGVHCNQVLEELASGLGAAAVITTRDWFLPEEEINRLLAPYIGGDDPVFGYLCTRLEMNDLLVPDCQARAARAIGSACPGPILIVGPGASIAAPEADLLVYADMPRWEGQLRQRRNEVSNLGLQNHTQKASLKYRRSFFADWRIADRLKRRTMSAWNFLLDTTLPAEPKLCSGAAHLAALWQATRQPFRVVPFFDPGPWGGQWMKEVCQLDPKAPNYAWCFDCVPEENSLLLAFSRGLTLEIPSLNLVFRHPRELLGDPVHGRFGAEFPIRFDFLDTMGGGNLSFQVHPDTEYAHAHFGLRYTQDESYYILDAAPGAEVYLGRTDGCEPSALLRSLEDAQSGKAPFDDKRFAARHAAAKHDHFLIPAGTLHCSGAGSMVLEISATPYIFTFKLWDWGRLGLDGKPRPIHLDHGRNVIRWERDATYARNHLINQFENLRSGSGWREERTGLHEAEFIETRRHWFTGVTPHDTGGVAHGSVNVLNLVEGDEAVVESPTGAFAPFTVHYAETFIVPAAVGEFTIRPSVGSPRECATMKAFVRHKA